MLPGETIVGDDIAYIRDIGSVARAVNVEAGIFGIIQDVNPKDDLSIYNVLTNPGEIVFSNVLVKDGKPYWLGMGDELPKDGTNFSGEWYEGKKDENGEDIPPAHKNARYAVALKALANCDSELDNPMGVELSGIMYGGRDTKAYVPVQQSFGWEHGIIAYGASLETETTFATIGQEGVPEINMMSIQDFISIPIGPKHLQQPSFRTETQKTPDSIRSKLLPEKQRRQISKHTPRQARMDKMDGTARARRSWSHEISNRLSSRIRGPAQTVQEEF